MFHCDGCGETATLAAGATECCGGRLCDGTGVSCYAAAYPVGNGYLGPVVARVKACCVAKAEFQARIINANLRIGVKLW